MKVLRRRAPLRSRTGWSRPVTFTVGLVLTQTLSLAGSESGARTDPAKSEGVSASAQGTEAQAENTSASSETHLTPEQWFEGGKETLNNWIEFAFGGLLTRGNQAEAQSRHQLRDGLFGGIQDLHDQTEVAKNTAVTLDGRALFDAHDYRLSVAVSREDAWYLRLHAAQSRLWSGPTGGGYAPEGRWYTFSEGEDWGLDRTELGIEAGVHPKGLPHAHFRYLHRTREGYRDATTWGMAHASTGNPSRVLGVAPALYDMDESVDRFELDVTHRIRKTDVGLGLRYEGGDLEHTRKVFEYPDEPVERKLTDRQGTRYDLLSVHAWSETWLRKNLFFSTGYLYANLDSDFDGSRIYGTDFGVGYVPGYPLGYTSLGGGAQQREHVMNANLLYQPHVHWVLIPSIRVQRLDADADSQGWGTQGRAGTRFSAQSERALLDVRERLELRYTGLTNWIFHATGDWTQGEGSLEEVGGLSLVGGTGVAPVRRDTDDSRLFQKYSVGVRWYSASWLSVEVGGYYKRHRYEYDHGLDSTANNSLNRYPAYLTYQRFDTWDGHAGLTLRPLAKVTLISRYEFQHSTVQTRPDAASGLSDVESALLTSHILQQSLGFTPWSRLTLQGSWTRVWSEVETPAAAVTRALLASENNYWLAQLQAICVLDDRTDLSTIWFYYRADNFEDFWADGLPLGVAAKEHGFMASCTRRLSARLRLTLRYGYVHHRDETFGQSRNYEAHWVASSMQYRF
ncbi:MAG: hypothetical protein RMN51_11050 [Verrucomicrobiota bacterium]|nr:hypothetical protein [Limisphaera sp.]MDW8382625.1 hypothetical protein [Verrucomicrobiota bacterium]